jgi:hypothetical protein
MPLAGETLKIEFHSFVGGYDETLRPATEPAMPPDRAQSQPYVLQSDTNRLIYFENRVGKTA